MERNFNEQEEQTDVMTVLPNEIDETQLDDILAVAERADAYVAAMKKIMRAAIQVTTNLDWVLIGGKPYLQESGATKVARLFGIGWRILDIKKENDGGYPSVTYRISVSMGRTTIECDGSRTGKDEFFTGVKTLKDGSPNPKYKGPDEIDANDVTKAAFTNALNNAIKRLLPGLRNISIEDLAAGGVNVGQTSAYTFKTGSKGGNSGKAADSGLFCSVCGEPITQAEASYSQGKMGAMLCRKCQKNPPPVDNEVPLPEEPPER